MTLDGAKNLISADKVFKFYHLYWMAFPMERSGLLCSGIVLLSYVTSTFAMQKKERHFSFSTFKRRKRKNKEI